MHIFQIDSLSFKSAASSFRSLNDDDTESMKSAVSATGSPVYVFTSPLIVP